MDECGVVYSPKKGADGWSHSPVKVSILILFASTCYCCEETMMGNGYSTSNIIETISNVDSCDCCALCYQELSCVSLSHQTDARVCTLYNKVASYATFQENSNHRYFIMSQRARSDTGAFCNQHSTCRHISDKCHGYICTADNTLTCHDLFREHQRSSSGMYWGYVNGSSIRLFCEMGYLGGGWTVISRSLTNNVWNMSLAMNRYRDTEIRDQPYSIMYLADHIAHSGESGQYQVDMDDQRQAGITIEVAANKSMLDNHPSPVFRVTRKYGGFRMDPQRSDPSVPWVVLDRTDVFVTTSPDPDDPLTGIIIGQNMEEFQHNRRSNRVTLMIREY